MKHTFELNNNMIDVNCSTYFGPFDRESVIESLYNGLCSDTENAVDMDDCDLDNDLYSECIVEAFQTVMENIELPVELLFDESRMSSPMYYNYSDDAVTFKAVVTKDNLKDMIDTVEKWKNDTAVREYFGRFKSGSGYINYGPESLEELSDKLREYADRFDTISEFDYTHDYEHTIAEFIAVVANVDYDTVYAITDAFYDAAYNCADLLVFDECQE